MSKVLATSTSFSKISVSRQPGDLLRSAGIELDHNQLGRPYTEAELLAVVADYDGIIAGADPFTPEVIHKGTRLVIIAKNGVGIDNIPQDVASRAGIFVTITPGAAEQTVADSTFALMLALARNIVVGDARIRQGEWPRLMGTEIWGKTLGIIGLGRIGRCVALRARGFNMTVLAYDPVPDTAFCEEHGVRLVDFETVFRESDIVTLHSPLNESTWHLVNEQTLRWMKPTAFLVNAARGGLVDEEALYVALQEKTIAGAAVDCFAQEPPGADFPLYGLENVVLTPHTAGYSMDTIIKTGLMAAQSVIAALEGSVPPNAVNADEVMTVLRDRQGKNRQ